MNKKFLQQLIRYLGNKDSNDQESALKSGRKVDPELEKEMKQMESIWNHHYKSIEPTPLNQMWEDFKEKVRHEEATRRKSQPRVKFQRIFSYSLKFAMVALILMIIPVSLHIYKNLGGNENVVYSEINVSLGQRETVQLADGTKIILDAGSYLRYPEKFGNERVVYLKGEAYFEVAHDKSKPFKVYANHALVQVLGTKFNVRAWEENPTVSVAVVEGKVSLSRVEKDKAKAILTKGYYSSLDQTGTPERPTQVDVEQYLGWMHNEIHFREATVQEVLSQLKRWYDFDIRIEDSSILNERVSVHLLRTNVDDVLGIIAVITNTQIKRDSNIIQITSR